jgi:hypothetical protein
MIRGECMASSDGIRLLTYGAGMLVLLPQTPIAEPITEIAYSQPSAAKAVT